MKESDFEYNKRMQLERHTLSTYGVGNFTGMGIFDLWGYRSCPNPKSETWKTFVDEVRVEILGIKTKFSPFMEEAKNEAI